jgi:hypothetical protein
MSDEPHFRGIAPLQEFTDEAIIPPPGTKAPRRRRPRIVPSREWWLGGAIAVLLALIIGFIAGWTLAP